MRPTRLLTYAWLALALLAAMLLLAACQLPIDDPYGAGQQFRELVDALLQDASEFLAGFCGLSPAIALAGVAAARFLGRRSS